MTMSINDVKKRGRGRPAVDSEAVTVRIAQPLLGNLEAWIDNSDDPKMSRAEAIRRLLAEALVRK